MLRYSFGLDDVADRISSAVQSTVKAGVRTGDIAFGKQVVSTTEMGQAIMQRLSQ